LSCLFPFSFLTRNAAGTGFDKYGIAHAGLGIWDTTTDVQFTIEFLSNDYVGGLLPNTTEDGYINWLNAGSIVITNPLDQSVWLNSRLITTTSGSAYSQIITYLQGNYGLFSSYQPVNGVYVNGSLLNSTSPIATDDLESVGANVLVVPTSSFTFVDQMINQLNSYGCDLGAFLQIYATSYDYIARENIAPSIVSWPEGEKANSDVYRWYDDLNACYHATYDSTLSVNGGATYFLQKVKTCYRDYAYIYLSSNSVYNVIAFLPFLPSFFSNFPSFSFSFSYFFSSLLFSSVSLDVTCEYFFRI
jgi:hypothetical protein